MNKPVVVFALTTPVSIQLLGNRLHLLVEAGVDLHVLIGEPVVNEIPELPREAIVHVIPLKRGIDPLNDAFALTKTIRLLKRLRPNLVAAATPKASLITMLAARIVGVPVRVWEVWGAKWDGPPNEKKKMLIALDRLIGKSATDVMAVSPSLARLLQREEVVRTEPRIVGSGSTKGVDTEVFRPASPHEHSGSPTLGFVGRISRDKGISDVLELARVLRTHVPSLRLLLVGEVDATDPPLRDDLNAIANEDWIEKTGWIQDTSQYYREMNALIFPSVREGLPNVLLEASASAVPIVAYAATGSVDVIEDRVTGFLVSIGDQEGLRQQALRVLESSTLADQLGTDARVKASSKFEARKVQRLWNENYLSLLNHGPAVQ